MSEIRKVKLSNSDINEMVARAVRAATTKATVKAEKVGVVDRNDPADNVRVASLDLAPSAPTEIPKEARNVAIEDGIVATLRAGRKPR